MLDGRRVQYDEAPIQLSLGSHAVRSEFCEPMNTEPIVTIVVPTYRQRGYLPDTLASITRNIRDGDEVLLVANGASLEYLAYLGGLVGAPVRLIEIAQPGVALARNEGLRQAVGDFVLFLDDDDALIDGGLEALRRMLGAERDWGGVAGEVVFFGERDNERGDSWPAEGLRLTPLRLLWENLTTPGELLLRTAAVRSLGGFDQRRAPADDFDLWVRLATAVPLVGVRVPMLRYRVHATAASRNAAHMANQWLATFTVHARAFGKPSDSAALYAAASKQAGYFKPQLLNSMRDHAKAGNWRASLKAGVMFLRNRAAVLKYELRAKAHALVVNK